MISLNHCVMCQQHCSLLPSLLDILEYYGPEGAVPSVKSVWMGLGVSCTNGNTAMNDLYSFFPL